MIIELLNNILGVCVPATLIAAGLYFAVKLRFFWILHPLKVASAFFKKNDENGVSPFRAVTVALAGTLGVGNIVGVAGAIAAGGFGAIFWMWFSALCSMVLKYAEIVLAVAHRREKGSERYGGAFYYIRDFFDSRGMLKTGRVAALVFCAFFMLEVCSTGCVVQINSAAQAIQGVAGVPPVVIGILTAALTVFAVSGGAGSVSAVTSKLIPLLSICYIGMSAAVMIIRADALPGVFEKIFSSAFRVESAVGGVFGFLTSRALRFGSMRGLLSNEAGCGTAPTAHASSNTKSPAEQGMWGIFEVFVDTIILCTMTAAVVIINYDEVCFLSDNGIMMAIRAFSTTLGVWSEYLLAASVAIFGAATVVCCAHYGRECVRYLSKNRNMRIFGTIFLIIYSAVTVAGAVLSPQSVWSLADLSIGGMTLINVAIICAMSGEVAEHTLLYMNKERKKRSDEPFIAPHDHS